MKPRRALALLLAAASMAAGAAERPPMTRPEHRTLLAIGDAGRARDCALAVAHVNEGLAAKYLEGHLIAGALFEDGLCVKPDWARAERLYLRAHEGGHGAGLLRLVAGYAFRSRDPAAALYGAHQRLGVLGLPADCRVAPSVAADDALFVKTLQLWPAGKVSMRFSPAAGTIEWLTDEVESLSLDGVRSASDSATQRSLTRQEALRQSLQAVAERALRRCERPLSVPPEWDARIQFVLTLQN